MFNSARQSILKLESILSLPTEQELRYHAVGLPSAMNPSDHLSLVARFAYLTN